MSSNPNTETAQQRRERLLAAQAERQRLRDEENARQEAEFAAEMERLEEEAAREEEERRIAEKRRVEEEKRREEERKLAEEKKIAEEQMKKQKELAEKKRKEEIAKAKEIAEEKQNEEKRLAEAKRREEERVAEAEDEQESATAFSKLLEVNRVEKEKAARELERRQKRKPRMVDVVVSPRPSGSKTKVFKSKSVISDDSDVIDVDKEQVETLRGIKRKRTIKMIAKKGNVPAPIGDFDAKEEDHDEEENEVPSPSQCRPACTRCVVLGKPASCRPQSTRRRTQACELCHVQRQRCSWIEDHASRRSRGKRAKVDDEIYQGPAARVGERKFEGSGVAEQLATIARHSEELVNIARRSLGLQERMLHLMVRRERREETKEELEKNEDEDEDGEGEEDEEEVEETKRREEVREGKKRAE
ncbi:hypothetical protein GGU11DRAFT_863487 [Lentinula aff. detonsa]|nr:hypothetical protein GGU11DRAFT_863487 [Lentinula aff. detonsa]